MTTSAPVSRRTVSRRGLLIALSIASVVLLAATITFGTMLFSMLDAGPRSGGTAPEAGEPTASATPTPEPDTVHGIPITVGDSALEFGTWVTELWTDGTTRLHAPIRNNSTTQAVTASYDLTAYDAEGRILDRVSASADLLPASEGIINSMTLRADPDEVASIVVEQTEVDADVSPYTGAVTGGEVEVDHETARVSTDMTSTLSPSPDSQDIQFGAFIGDELIGLCEIGAEAEGEHLAAYCFLTATSSGTDFDEDYYRVLPDDLDVRAFLRVRFDLE